jgi:hypothetical protein
MGKRCVDRITNAVWDLCTDPFSRYSKNELREVIEAALDEEDEELSLPVYDPEKDGKVSSFILDNRWSHTCPKRANKWRSFSLHINHCPQCGYTVKDNNNG